MSARRCQARQFENNSFVFDTDKSTSNFISMASASKRVKSKKRKKLLLEQRVSRVQKPTSTTAMKTIPSKSLRVSSPFEKDSSELSPVASRAVKRLLSPSNIVGPSAESTTASQQEKPALPNQMPTKEDDESDDGLDSDDEYDWIPVPETVGGSVERLIEFLKEKKQVVD